MPARVFKLTEADKKKPEVVREVGADAATLIATFPAGSIGIIVNDDVLNSHKSRVIDQAIRVMAQVAREKKYVVT